MTSRDSSKRRDVILTRIVAAHLSVSPIRQDAARKYAEMIDAIGSSAAMARLRVHEKLLEVSYNVGDTANTRREARAALAAAAEIPIAQRAIAFEVVRSVLYQTMSMADVMRDSVLANYTMQNYHDLLESLIAANSGVSDSLRKYLTPQLPVLQGMLMAEYVNALGEKAQLSPVTAEHWFAENGSPISALDPSIPTLVLRISPHRCNGIFCEKAYGALRRLAASYQPRGVKVVLLVSTTGYLHFSVFDSLPDEVRAIRAYVQDTLKLPGILAVSESNLIKQQDGKIQQVPRGNEAYSLNWFVIRDGKGISRTKGLGFLSDRPESEAWVRRALDRMLNNE